MSSTAGAFSFLALAGGLSPSGLAAAFLAAGAGLSALGMSLVSGVSELGAFSAERASVSASPAAGFFGSSAVVSFSCCF
ncbi:MAG: hypothetical protein EAZ39_00125 [Oscillatoriales cyanobacterium]|nr:MAG: hypothetical protein EAZ39_00125 [Oscillatoriales cyanobacterium]